MSPEQRSKALAKRAYREAAMETDGAVSGISDVTYDLIFNSELASRFPSELTAISETEAALEAVSTTLETVGLAVTNELKSVEGTPVSPRRARQASEHWE
jgi:hypothetical protein